jgi:hypothetical protein
MPSRHHVGHRHVLLFRYGAYGCRFSNLPLKGGYSEEEGRRTKNIYVHVNFFTTRRYKRKKFGSRYSYVKRRKEGGGDEMLGGIDLMIIGAVLMEVGRLILGV